MRRLFGVFYDDGTGDVQYAEFWASYSVQSGRRYFFRDNYGKDVASFFGPDILHVREW